MLSAMMVVAAGGAVAVLLQQSPQLRGYLFEAVRAAKGHLEEALAHAAPTEMAVQAPLGGAPSTTSAAAPQPIAERAQEIADAPGATAGVAVPSSPTAVGPDVQEVAQDQPLEPAAAGAEAQAEAQASDQSVAGDSASAAKAEPLPPAVADPANPLQKRALAIGLHPDVSASLLKRLSAADYRNGKTAIKTALAETPDSAVYVWPKTPQAKLAQFEVRFVKGAPENCRRYVVIVTKDRWSTTAPAMESCGPGAHPPPT